MPTLFELWAGTSPQWERRYGETVINRLATYGEGANQNTNARGKDFGAGYEIFILAFFLGLYANETRALVENPDQKKTFGVPIANWGKNKANNRKRYDSLQRYMFAALVARTDLDLIALDRGEIASKIAAGLLRKKMEEYANWGFNWLNDQLYNDPMTFNSDRKMLDVFLQFFPNVEEPEEE